MAGKSSILSVTVLMQTAKLKQGIKDTKKELKSFGDSSKDVGKTINKAFAAIGIGLSIAGLKQMATAAMEDSKAQALMARSMRNATGANQDQIKSAEAYIQKLQMQTAILDDNLRPAFSTIYRTTKDLTTSQHLLNIATDVSAGTGKDLSMVSQAIAKAYTGQYASLNKLIPGINKAKNPIQELEKSFKGLAETAGNQNPFAKIDIILNDVQERLGAVLLPYLERLGAWLSTPEGSGRLEVIIQQMATILDMAGRIAEAGANLFSDKNYQAQGGLEAGGRSWLENWWLGFQHSLANIDKINKIANMVQVSGSERALMPSANAAPATAGYNSIFGAWKPPKIKGVDKTKEVIKSAITTLKKTLDDVRSTIKDFSDKFRNAVELSFGIVEQGVKKAFRPDKVLAEMKRVKDATKDFNANLETLKAAGGNEGKSLIEQILGLPPEEAAAVAAAYVNDIGTFKETIAVGGQLANTGTTAGKFANQLQGNQTEQQMLDELRVLNRELAKGKNTYNIKTEMSANQIVTAIKNWEKSTGKKVLAG